MARYIVAEEFYGSKRYMVHICTVFCKYHGTKWYMVEMVRFSENCTVFNGTVYGSSRPRYTHGKPYRGKNRGKFTV